MGKSNTGKIILIIILILVLIGGTVGAFFIAKSMGLFKSGNNSNSTDLKGVPSCEYVGTYDYIYMDYTDSSLYNYSENSDKKNVTVLFGKPYSKEENKLYFYTDNPMFNNMRYDNNVASYTKNAYNGEVQTPYNDKNIVFAKLDEDYSVEIKNTEDVSMAFPTLENSNILICISPNYVKAVNIENSEELWRVSPDQNTYFATETKSISTDRKKLIIDMYTQYSGRYKYSDSTIINLKDGSSKKLKYSGLVTDYDGNSEKDTNVIDVKIDSSAVICGDKYLCTVTSNKFKCIVNEEGKILLSSGVYKNNILPIKKGENDTRVGAAYAIANGKFVFFTNNSSEKYYTAIVLNNDLSINKSYKLDKSSYKSFLQTTDKTGYTRDYQTFYMGNKAYSLVGTTGNDLSVVKMAFDGDGNLLPGFNINEEHENSLRYNMFTKISEDNMENHDSTKDKKVIIDLYTGEIKDFYKVASTVNNYSQGEIIFLENEDGSKSFCDLNFNKIYTTQFKNIYTWKNNEKSNYMAFLNENKESIFNQYTEIYAVNKDTKELLKIDYNTEEYSVKQQLMVNGDFLLYVLSKDGTEELHAYNLKDKKDNIIYQTKKQGEEIDFQFYEDARQNNWFYVKNENSSYDVYKLK